MAHHQSAKKRIRQTETRRIENRYYAVSMRNALRDIRASENKEEALKMLPEVCSLLDKLSNKNIIHKKKASNLKSKITKYVSKLQ